MYLALFFKGIDIGLFSIHQEEGFSLHVHKVNSYHDIPSQKQH